MSKYTIELRELFTPIKFNPPIYTKEEVEAFFTNYEISDYLTTEQIAKVNEAGIWSKEKLAKKIVNHYFMREIGQETIGLWKHYVKATMDEIMEEYLPLIYARSVQYTLSLTDYTETFTRNANVNNTGNSNSNSINSGNSIGINSDTPQGRITKEAILSGNFATATAGTETESQISNTTNTNSGSNSTESYTKTKTNQNMIETFRKNILAIDKEIIEKLEPLFMGLY